MQFNNLNEAERFLSPKISDKILNFNDFIFESEELGYGNQDFFFAKNGDTCNYFFKIQTNQVLSGFVISISKFAKFAHPTEDKIKYGVLSITKLKTEDLDQAVISGGKYTPNTDIINVDDKTTSKLLKQLGLIVNDYIQKNPSVVKFYDEMQVSLSASDYDNKFALSLASWPGGNEKWKLQTIEEGKYNTIST